ncbi:hypothetical protein ONZ45_g8272 [Pleurotus djamor]|nr:hypothetical protein ONZ45_g8272 [Pleurotus djamor]
MRFLLIVVSASIATLSLGSIIDHSLAVTKRTVQFRGHELTITTTPLTTSRAERLRNTSQKAVTGGDSLRMDFNNHDGRVEGQEKRAAPINAFNIICSNLAPTVPSATDCTLLSAALLNLDLQTAAQSQGVCAVPQNVNCPNFVVAPLTEATFSLGTCLLGFANLDTVNSFAFCDFRLAQLSVPMFQTCFVDQRTTGAIAVSPTAQFAVELVHA